MDFDSIYQDIIFDHYKNPRNKADLSDIPEEEAAENPSCGDAVKLKVDLDVQGKIEDIRFDGHGCAISIASVSMMTQWLKGTSSEEALAYIEGFLSGLQGDEDFFTGKGDLEALRGVGSFPARIKCATLCWHSLKEKLIRGAL